MDGNICYIFLFNLAPSTIKKSIQSPLYPVDLIPRRVTSGPDLGVDSIDGKYVKHLLFGFFNVTIFVETICVYIYINVLIHNNEVFVWYMCTVK